MTFSGDLRDINLADVFQNIHTNRLTGTVTVTQVGGKRFIYFKTGMVAGFSLGINRSLPIGDHLVHRQLLDRTALDRARRRQTSKKSALRVALSALGYVDEATFRAAVADLVMEQICDLLPVREAEFTFTEGKPVGRAFDVEQMHAGLCIDPSTVLMEAARRADEWSRIRQVIVSDHDIFVMVDGWEDIELHGVAAEAAVWLDGRTELSVLIENLPHSRFEVHKAVYQLVQEDLARPLANREMEVIAQEAVQSGHAEEAVALLNRALQTERRNDDLRSQLVEALERSGRGDEAAAELAILGHNAVVAGESAAAVELYSRAASLKPRDVALQEKRVELLRDQDPAGHIEALLEFAEALQAAGLGEKARSVLSAAVADADPKTDAGGRLLDCQARLEADLGCYKTAAAIYVDLAKHRRKSDVEGRLSWLRRAAEVTPEDRAIQQAVEDLAAGKAERRRRARRRSVVAVSTATIMVVLVCMGVVELVASHRVIRTLETEIVRIVGGQPRLSTSPSSLTGSSLAESSLGRAALPDLHDIQVEYGWTWTGRRARELERKLFELRLGKIRALLDDGQPTTAVDQLLALRDVMHNTDDRQRIRALETRAVAEIPAARLFARINVADPERSALRAFAQLTAPELLTFHLHRLARRGGILPTTRQRILEALRRINDARALAPVARVFVHSIDPSVRVVAAEILRGATAHRTAGRERQWAVVYDELEAAGNNALTALRAGQALAWLRGD